MSLRKRIAIGIAIVLAVLILIPATMTAIGLIRFVTVPSENMEPTLAPGNRMIAWMRPPAEWHRGDIILFRPPDNRGLWVKRIVGLPGDRIAMVDGVVMLNGRPVPQRLLGTLPQRPERMYQYGREPRRRLAEQFPGEASPHEILDSGETTYDNFDEVIVAPGRLFVMGDNRDDSADSRMAIARGGVEQLPFEQVAGTPWFHVGWSRFGEAAGH